MKKFGIVLAICVVIALGVLCFLIINSEEPYLNTNKVINNGESPSPSQSSDLDVVNSSPSPTATNGNTEGNGDKKDENKQDENINKKVIAKDELGKDVTGTEYEDGTLKKNWEKINIGNYRYYESTTIELDLDGDNIKEKVGINESGRYIYINDIGYIVNKYLNENDKTPFIDYNVNQYHIVDLNSDGVLEIIHRTISGMVSPCTSKYTIYNYTNNELKEIGNISIIGNIPDEIYVKGNKIKFEYWPYETPIDYTEEVVCELDV